MREVDSTYVVYVAVPDCGEAVANLANAILPLVTGEDGISIGFWPSDKPIPYSHWEHRGRLPTGKSICRIECLVDELILHTA